MATTGAQQVEHTGQFVPPCQPVLMPAPPRRTRERLARQVGPRVGAGAQVQGAVGHGVGLADGVASEGALAAVGVYGTGRRWRGGGPSEARV